MTGTCDTAPSDSFDPLAYWVEQAHARNLRLEAWVNPYRICAGANAQSDFDALPDASPAKQHPDWVVSCDGGYYFNPGIAEVRQLICDGVSEIVSKYAVDGIQFDDYFYPSTQFDDAAAYQASGSNLPLADWRRDNVNQLVQAVTPQCIKMPCSRAAALASAIGHLAQSGRQCIHRQQYPRF